MIAAEELAQLVRAYDEDVDQDAIIQAYEFSKHAHRKQIRASGEIYFTHPLQVAVNLTHLKLDAASIITALLHDTVEDTEATPDDIEKKFGEEVKHLVNGVTKLNKISMQSHQTSQAENFRKLVLAMSKDIRVLLVKLSDRVHNMQTLHYIPAEEKRQRIARETLEIYAPLAERISVTEFKDILQDESFNVLNHDARESIVKRLNFLREQGPNFINNTTEELSKTLLKQGIKSQISGREKTPYSIWKKMQRQNIAFEQLADIVAFRVIVDTIPDCYHVLGVIHSEYSVVPNRFKDYISTPKNNGYQSIHTCVIGPGKQRIEIQIRTKEMHEMAELGVAAHWRYKQQNQKNEGTQYRWIRELLEILEQAGGAEEFLENTKLEMYQDQVFCFSPRGDVYALPHGATPVDFAYAIHSEIGDHCVGAKVNGKIAPLRTQLKNGDQVDIIQSKTQTPSPEWERFVITGKARARIRRFIRQKQAEEYGALGRQILQKYFKQENKTLSDKILEPHLNAFKCATIEDLYIAIGSGLKTGSEVISAVFPAERPHLKTPAPKKITKPKIDKKAGKPILIEGLIPGMAMHFAKCCHPLPGDRIVGIVTTGKGVTIHTTDCQNLEKFSEMPERWLDISWGDTNQTQTGMNGRLTIVMLNEKGGLSELSTIIAQNHGNISNLKITNRAQDFFELIVDIEVNNVKHLLNIIAALRASSMINSVDRTKN